MVFPTLFVSNRIHLSPINNLPNWRLSKRIGVWKYFICHLMATKEFRWPFHSCPVYNSSPKHFVDEMPCCLFQYKQIAYIPRSSYEVVAAKGIKAVCLQNALISLSFSFVLLFTVNSAWAFACTGCLRIDLELGFGLYSRILILYAGREPCLLECLRWNWVD